MRGGRDRGRQWCGESEMAQERDEDGVTFVEEEFLGEEGHLWTGQNSTLYPRKYRPPI